MKSSREQKDRYQKITYLAEVNIITASLTLLYTMFYLRLWVESLSVSPDPSRDNLLL